MALVEFTNNQAPYLNAENLNNNFNELKNDCLDLDDGQNLINTKIGDMENLETDDKNNLVAAINSLVIDSGTNANGSWIKYSDGTMICTGKKNSGAITWSSDSNHYLKSGLAYDNFPQEFISQPIVSKTIESVSPSSRYMGIIGGSAPTTTNAGTYNLITYWNASGTSVVASYIAIGKWK